MGSGRSIIDMLYETVKRRSCLPRRAMAVLLALGLARGRL
jgi:hypothetical protein